MTNMNQRKKIGTILISLRQGPLHDPRIRLMKSVLENILRKSSHPNVHTYWMKYVDCRSLKVLNDGNLQENEKYRIYFPMHIAVSLANFDSVW